MFDSKRTAPSTLASSDQLLVLHQFIQRLIVGISLIEQNRTPSGHVSSCGKEEEMSATDPRQQSLDMTFSPTLVDTYVDARSLTDVSTWSVESVSSRLTSPPPMAVVEDLAFQLVLDADPFKQVSKNCLSRGKLHVYLRRRVTPTSFLLTSTSALHHYATGLSEIC